MRNQRRAATYAAMAAVILISGCARQTTNTIEKIQTVPATIGNIDSHVTFIGNVSGGQTSTLTWKTSGVIETVNVKIGDLVTEGQVLASLAPDSLTADVISAEVPYISAMDELEETLDSETPKAQAYKDLKDKEGALIDAENYRESIKYPRATIGDIKYWSEQTEIERQYYEEALETLNEIASWKNSPDKWERDSYDARRKAMLNALNKYAETYNNYIYYSGHASENDIAQAAADIDVAQAEYDKALKIFQTYAAYPREKDVNEALIKVDNARETYDRRNIIATINGTVTQIDARPGDYVTSASSAFRLDNITRFYIPMNISEIDILQIHDGMQADIILDANPDKTYHGIVTTISNQGTASGSRVTFQTLIEIQDPDDNLKIGMTAEVNLLTASEKDTLLVPANALYNIGTQTYVGISNGTTCNDTPVTVGLTTDTLAQITGGFLREGDPVCVPAIDNKTLEELNLTPKTNQRNEE